MYLNPLIMLRISCFQIFNQTTTRTGFPATLAKYRVFKSLIKPQPILGEGYAKEKYRVFKSLIKPQHQMLSCKLIRQYRVFKSLIKPQLVYICCYLWNKYRVFKSLIKPQPVLNSISILY